MTNTLDSGKSPMSMVSSFRRECSDQAGSDMKVSGWPIGNRAWRGGTPEYLRRPYDTESDWGRMALRRGGIRDRRPGQAQRRSRTHYHRIGFGEDSGLPTSCHKLLLGVMGPGLRQEDNEATPPPAPAHWRGPRLR